MNLIDLWSSLQGARQQLINNVLPSQANAELKGELADRGFVEDANTSQLTQGPYSFLQVIPAAGLAVGQQLDLTTYVAGPPSLGGISSALFPNNKPVAGQPKTMVYTDAITIEISQDPLYATETSFLFDIMSSLEIRFKAQQGSVATDRVRDFGYSTGTVQTSGTDAVSVPAVGPGLTRSSGMRIAKVIPVNWAISLSTDTFAVAVNGKPIPALPADVKVRVTVFGCAYTNINNPQDYRQGPCSKDTGSLGALRFGARQIKNSRMIAGFRDIIGMGR